MEQYFIGGLEPSKTSSYTLGGKSYLNYEKFKTSLRNNLIDWGAFLEIYKKNTEYNAIYENATRLLNIKKGETSRSMFLPVLLKIYDLPAKNHLASMMKQFMLHEPVSIAIYSLFNSVKHHYEYLVKRYFLLRNKYVKKHKTNDNIVNWKETEKRWDILNDEHDIDTSSLALFFINPIFNTTSMEQMDTPKLYWKINTKDKKILSAVNKLMQQVNKFSYKGFCPKVPVQRMEALLKFPLQAFVSAIKVLNPNEKLPNYDNITEKIHKILKNHIKKPTIDIKLKKKPIKRSILKKVKLNVSENEVNAEITKNRLELTKWIIQEIFKFRKQLIQVGSKYEQYYINVAHQIEKIDKLLKKQLIN